MRDMAEAAWTLTLDNHTFQDMGMVRMNRQLCVIVGRITVRYPT